ncbi:Outer membrane protein beta-barrel domain-containing protein [Arachidicoccus rhizosphaerae]|uniref:Outer membrane protein beta-barrel domain-containing protein n=1 Tax=Arachidicoccus rhizosphaerae TaxID=551991 RepID=A0A1H3W7T0_9BACT|nr:Outer membrane protein beta-barrel domain-containing protein [Arachidicoccus rhizosphaerae]
MILRARHIIFLLTALFVNGLLVAQTRLNRENHDLLPFYFGISIGYNNSNIQSTRAAAFEGQSTFSRVEPHSSNGLALGFVATKRLSDRFEIRTVPKLILGGSKYLSYYYTTDYLQEHPDKKAIEDIKLPANIFSIPLQLKLNSDRINNFRVFMFAGMKYDINLSANSAEYKAAMQLDQNPPPLFRKGDVGYEGGIGFNFYLPFTVISPQIKLSNTLGNSHVRDVENPYSNVMQRFRTQMVVFSVTFEQ